MIQIITPIGLAGEELVELETLAFGSGTMDLMLHSGKCLSVLC